MKNLVFNLRTAKAQAGGCAKVTKSSRMAKVLTTLTLLLTLGVGQMWAWATNVYLNGDFTGGNWNKATYQFTWWYNGTDGKYYRPVYATGSTQYFRLWTNNHVGPASNNTTITTSGSSASSYSENNWKYTGKAGIINICVDQTGGKDWNPWVWYERPTIKFKHGWDGGSWTEQNATDNNDGTYQYKGKYGGTTGFNAGPSGDLKYKTSATTVTGSPSTGDYCLFVWNASGYKNGTGEGNDCGTFTITKLCTITYDANGATSGTKPADQTDILYNTSTTVRSNSGSLAKTGYTFAGWNTESNGSGTTYTAGSGSIKPTAVTTTLYAKWLPQSLTITSHPTYLTTTDKLNLSISYENIPEGYCFRVKELRTGGYYNSEANGTYDPISGTGSTTYTSSAYLPLGADRIVLELWNGTPGVQQTVVSNEVAVTVEQGWEVGVQAKTDGVISTAGGTVSPASVSPTAHIGRTITAEAKVGYDFTGWTANTVNITFDNDSELSTTVYATAGGAIYANFAKQSSSYTTTFYAGDHGSINAKGTAIAKNGSASVTIGENETLSATPESADYVFDHWGTTGSVSVANIYSATTTVTATAAGGTVTAYYRHIPVLGAVTAAPSGQQNYAGSPIDFALSVTSTYLAHPVVVFLVNDGTTTFEVVGAPYGADGSSAAGTIGSDAAYTTVHKATFTASAAKSYTVSAKLYEGELIDNFEGANTRGWAGDNLGSGSMTFANNPVKMTINGSNKVMQVTRTGGADWGGAIMSFTAVGDRATCDAAGSNDYAYIHARMKDATDATHLKNNDNASDGNNGDINPSFVGATSSDWRHVTYHNTHCSNNFLYFMIQRGNTDNKTVYIDDIILSNEETMTVKASQAATASFSINWDYTVTLNNNGATSAGTESVNVTYGSATGITDITVPTKTGYTFGGYYTEDAGAGTLQINASGVWQNGGYVSGGNWNSGSNQTLYAKWTAKTYDITYVDANNVATIATNPSTGSTDATINFTVTLNPGFKSLSVTAVDAGSNTVTVTNPSANTYRFTMPASNVTVTVTATALPIVYVLKTKHASSSLGDGATGFPSDGKIWAWKASGSNNFYTSPGDFPGPSASSKATAITDDIIGDEWYRFIPDNISQFDGSTAYHVILTSTNQILNTQTTFIENGSSRSAATHTGTIWIVPHGTDANTAYLYTSYPDEIVTPYNTTYYAGDHGSINVFGTTITSGNSQTIATTKNRTLTATPASGYEFNRWVTSGSVTVADATSATTTVSATGAGGTVTATYFEAVNSGWYIKGDPAGSDWISPTSLPLNRVLPGETNVYYRPVTLPANDQYFRFWCSNGGNHQYGASSKNLAVSKDTKYNLTYDGDNAFKYSAGGTVWFVVDASGDTKKCWLQDPVEFYSVNFGYGDGCDEFTAKDGEDKDLVSGNTYVSGTELTFTQTKKDGYTFVGWNTAADGSGSSLGTGSSYTVASLSADVNVYAIYTENKTAITITTDGHGTITTPDPNESPYSLGVATTQAINATASDGYHWNTWTVSGTAALVSSASTQSNTVKGNGTDGGTGTVTATFTPNTYRVQFHRNGGAGVVVYQDFTYDVAQNLTANSYTRTGYNFAGWALTTDGAVTYANGENVSNLTSENGATFHLYAKWTPKQSALTFDYQTSAEGYGASGSIAAVSATYGAAMPALTGNMPTAAQGYAFMGFYSETGGNGTLYYNPDKTSAHNWDVDTESTTTLYAYYKKSEITAVVLNHDIFEPVAEATGVDDKDYVFANPTIAPAPTPTTKLCWELRYSNDNPVAGDDYRAILVSGDQVKFKLVGLAAGGYKIHVELRTGSECGAGTLLSSYDKSFSIASDHTVTIQYRSDSLTGPVIKASTTNPGKPLEGTEITAPEIIGYTFSKWKAGDGVTIEGADANGEKASATITYTANYDGVLTAIYSQKRMIYFYNSLGWSNVYVYFYNTDEYWSDTYGSGAQKNQAFNGDHKPYWEEEHGTMTQIEGTNIWYYDCNAMTERANVVFTKDNKHDNQWFYQTEAVRRDDYNRNLPMYVPIDLKTQTINETDYYNTGYWMNYPENTGYTLRIYNSWDANNSTGAAREYPFPFSADTKMPLKLGVEFNFTGQAWFMIYRKDGQLLGKKYTMKQEYHETALDVGSINKIEIKTSAAGEYKFTLSYLNIGTEVSPNYQYYIYVEYPVSIGDYRILYKDGATWSQSSAHDASWYHESDIIRKNSGEEAKADTVSLFVSYGSSPSAKFQKVTAIDNNTGVVTWTDVASGTVSLSSIEEKGVYNFIVSQPAGGASISLTKTEKYTGNFYIRTDCAGTTKWDNYRAFDHQMTYTEYSMSAANSFGDKYSHYYCHWCPRNTNIKFCVANDYSSCISDTLEYDLTDLGNLNAGGQLKHEDGKSVLEDRYSANVRFMYNQETNKISRAYVASSTNAARKFLVLRGNQVIKGEDGSTAINDQSVTNGAILSDKENWIYERILYINPGTRFKLFACYAEATPTEAGAQYFRGAYDSDQFTSNDNSVILISGTGSYQKARVLYDFKTNRLVCAWLPSDDPIGSNLDIDADVMVIRDHQEAAECITFSGSGKLTEVKTVYGAMKFNRWTLNNRYRGKGGVEDNNKDHCATSAAIAEYHGILPAGEQKSVYERSLYFISFPFDVKVSEIFGFGTYGKHWVLEYYDGLNRAKNGYWIDSPANWKYVTPSMAKTYELKAYEGYILCLSLGRMAYDNTEIWPNNISNVELYFPSKTPMTNIQTTDVTIPGLSDEYRCTINREGEDGDRRIKDSYWRCLGVPSYDMYAGTLTSDGSTVINWQTDYSTFPFLYAWNMNDNTLTPQSTNRFSFKPMHAYLTQIGTAIYWTNVSATPAVMARQTEEPTEYNWCLTLNAGEQMIDQTYVRMSTDEVITNEFDFGQDLSKELNTGRSDIYSFIGNERAAANSMQMNTETTTIVPLGLNIEATGEYTFSIPDGTNGVGITLIDEETGIRTSLSALDYTVELAAGDYTERFWIEISPVKGAETGIDPGVDARENGVRKVMIDGLLYIVRDGKMYDATGKRVE